MRIPEKVTFTLPSCDASVMRLTTKLLKQSDAVEVLLETEQLRASLPLVSYKFKLDLWTVKGCATALKKLWNSRSILGVFYGIIFGTYYTEKKKQQQANKQKKKETIIESNPTYTRIRP